MDTQEFINLVGDALEDNNVEELERLGELLVEGGHPQFPFEPSVQLIGQDIDTADEGQVAMVAVNGWSRAYRLAKFRRRMKSGYSGPVIVSEGDSWFQYPWLLKDTIDNLMSPFAINSLGAAGDTLSNMMAMREYRQAIAGHNADVFLFSASGNDALGNGNLSSLLNPFVPGMEIDDILRDGAVQSMLSRIEDGFETIIRDALSVRSELRIFFHGYDRPIPRKGGKWLGKPMAKLGIPAPLHAAIAGRLIDNLNLRLHRLEQRFPQRAYHVDCRGRVGGSINSWYDELHPRNSGYARVADLFEAQIRAKLPAKKPVHVAGLEVLEPQEPVTEIDIQLSEMDEQIQQEALIGTVRPRVFQRQLSQLDKHIINEFKSLQREAAEPDFDNRLRTRRNLIPQDDDQAFERILGESNLFPINYLSRGARKARAVAKVMLFARGEIPNGSGTGFLVGPGLLLTNNHVISTKDGARRAKALFDYQDGNSFEPMATQMFNITDDVFFTSDSSLLDFTFVSVQMDNSNGDTLGDLGQFTLIEESGKAVKGEPVSIIQHPLGARKSIALRESTIIGVKGNFIYYSTDTERGSSGSPVLNDQWLPVALHHRSVPHPEIPNKWIANRGIRISQIFNALREAAEQGDRNAKQVLHLIGADPVETAPSNSAPLVALRKREDQFLPQVNTGPQSTEIGVTEETFQPNRWDGVQGYNPEFLSQRIALPLPADGKGILQVNGRPDLPYKHFSVVMHQDRKLAMLTACNTDGCKMRRLPRAGRWRLDSRIPRNAQVDNEAYRHNDYDRGHLVRRLAPMWGSQEDARMAMADTFHYTVCAPQHARLNQGIWLQLENYLLDWAEENRAKLSIFTGPVFRADDPIYRGIVQVPADYWKIAIAETEVGLKSVAYLHTQKHLIPTVEEAFGDYRTHRLRVEIIGELTGLDVSALQAYDIANTEFETQTTPQEVKHRQDIGF